MKWENDPQKYEKLFLLDAIMQLSQEFQGLNFDSLTYHDIQSFIDEFIENYEKK